MKETKKLTTPTRNGEQEEREGKDPGTSSGNQILETAEGSSDSPSGGNEEDDDSDKILTLVGRKRLLSKKKAAANCGRKGNPFSVGSVGSVTTSVHSCLFWSNLTHG